MTKKSDIEVTVLYFQSLSRLIGRQSEKVSIPWGTTLGDLFERLIGEHPGLTSHRETLLFAVDQEQASSDRVLVDGDEVALMPPFSGG